MSLDLTSVQDNSGKAYTFKVKLAQQAVSTGLNTWLAGIQKALTLVMGKRLQVVAGAAAATSGTKIYLPPPKALDEEGKLVYLGKAFHEASHNTEGSDFEHFKSIHVSHKHGGLVARLINIVDDIRCENQFQVRYPRVITTTRPYWQWKDKNILPDLDQITGNMDPLMIVMNIGMLFIARCRADQLGIKLTYQPNPIIESFYRDYFKDLEAEAHAQVVYEDSVALAMRLYERIKDMFKDQKSGGGGGGKPQDDNQDQDDDQQSQSSDQNNQQEDDNDNSSDKSEDDVDDKSNGDSSSKDDEDSGDSSDGEQDDSSNDDDSESDSSSCEDSDDTSESGDDSDGDNEDSEAGAKEDDEEKDGENSTKSEDSEASNESKPGPENDDSDESDTSSNGDGKDDSNEPSNESSKESENGESQGEDESSGSEEEEEESDNERSGNSKDKDLDKEVEDTLDGLNMYADNIKTPDDAVIDFINSLTPSNYIYFKSSDVKDHIEDGWEGDRYSADEISRQGIELMGKNGRDMIRHFISQTKPYTLRAQQSGRFDMRTFTKKRYSFDVYNRKIKGKLEKAAIAIALDNSASMKKISKNIIASQLLSGLLYYTDKYDVPTMAAGYTFEDNYFTSDDERTYPIRIDIIKRFKERYSTKVKSRCVPLPDSIRGGTPDLDCVRWMTPQLWARPESKKILFVICDGDPTAYGASLTLKLRASYKLYLDQCKLAGIRVFGFGIQANLQPYFGDDWCLVTATSLGDMFIDKLKTLLNN